MGKAKYWAFLFLLVPILGVGLFAAAPALRMWLPADMSEHGHTIDHLFVFIMYLTGAVFIATEVVLVWYLWKYDANSNPAPTKFTHGSHSLEVVWTILPAATLLFIAIYQINAWADQKLERRAPLASVGPDGEAGTSDDVPKAPTAEITGRQFEWRIRYPGPDGILHTSDDLLDINDLHIPVDEEIVLVIKSEDVLHSFFLPNFRVKQDVVPGMKQKVWFKAVKGSEGRSYDLVCAELCGWGHYKMKGRLTVDTQSDYRKWLEQLSFEQHRTSEPAPLTEEEQ
jgi:cytochrome c oxidase subunit 2